jgi:hypothetical protein
MKPPVGWIRPVMLLLILLVLDVFQLKPLVMTKTTTLSFSLPELMEQS